MEQFSRHTLIKQKLEKITKDLKELKKLKGAKKTSKFIKENLNYEVERLTSHVESSLKSNSFNFIPATEKFFTTMGLEYTFLRPKKLNLSCAQIIKQLINISDKRQGWNKRFHQDGEDVVECAGPVHKNWSELIFYYRSISSSAKKLGLTTKSDISGSGGCHIHMGIPRHWKTDFRLRFLRTLHLDITARPYLNWIFNECIDYHNANSVLTSEVGVKFILQTYGGDNVFPRVFENDYHRSFTHINLDLMNTVNTKSYAVRYDSEYDTIEFRIFDMVDNEKMLEDYIEFANAYFRFIYYKTKDYSGHNYKEFEYCNLSKNSYDIFKDKKTVIEYFNALLDELGLEKNNYKRYIKINYFERLKLAEAGEVKMDYDMLQSFEWPKLVEKPKILNVKGRDLEVILNNVNDVIQVPDIIEGRDITLTTRLSPIGGDGPDYNEDNHNGRYLERDNGPRSRSVEAIFSEHGEVTRINLYNNTHN